MSEKKRTYQWISHTEYDDHDEAEEVVVGRSPTKKSITKKQEKEALDMVNLSIHEAALAHLSPAARSVYEFAYTKANMSPETLQPDRQHVAFLEHLLNKHTKFVFLTGIPGSGKSTILNLAHAYLLHKVAEFTTADSIADMKELLKMAPTKQLKTHEVASKTIVCTAPTGTAAASIKGAITFSALFAGCDLINGRFETPHDVLDVVKLRLLPIKVLIIDEISMVHPSMFANGDKIFRIVKNMPRTLYGGIKLIVSGDFFQLKPVFSPKDDITKAMKLLAKNALSKNQHPLVFDTASWMTHEHEARYIQLDRSFRQEASQLQFMDLLSAVRDETLREVHRNLLASRVMTYDAFCETTQDDVTPVFKRRMDVDTFNISRLNILPGTEYAYMCALICSNKTFRQMTQCFSSPLEDDEQQDNQRGYLANVRLPTTTTTAVTGAPTSHGDNDQQEEAHPTSFLYAKILDRQFACKPNPISMYNPKAAMIEGLTHDGHSGYYFEKSILAVPTILKMAQEQDGHLGRSNFLTRLKVGAPVSLTQNLSIKHGLTNGCKGVVVHFMSIASFMSASGTKKANGTYIATRRDPRETCTIQDDEQDAFKFRTVWGLVDETTGKSKNEAPEMFPLIEMTEPCQTKYLLLTPVLTQINAVSEHRQRQDTRRMGKYMSKSLANNSDQSGTPSKMTLLDPSQHLALISQAKRNIIVDYGKNDSQTRIYALHMPVTLAWATTIHSVQGLTVKALWLGDTNAMDDGMFYVVLSRVSRLDCIAWGSDPYKYIKANSRVKAFYARLIAMEASRHIKMD